MLDSVEMDKRIACSESRALQRTNVALRIPQILWFFLALNVRKLITLWC